MLEVIFPVITETHSPSQLQVVFRPNCATLVSFGNTNKKTYPKRAYLNDNNCLIIYLAKNQFNILTSEDLSFSTYLKIMIIIKQRDNVKVYADTIHLFEPYGVP